ncbi:MAG: 2-amino-4-hydroxy-6-hydroxymethyldihydropteridine diphosphokinase [Armatimonadota bacterium]
MRVYLGLGSNLNDRERNIGHAVELLAENPHIEVLRVSSMYETSPVGYKDQPDFINAVALIETTLSPRELLDAVQAIEELMGRKRTFRWGPRVIDIDVLLYGSETIDEEGIKIPHPMMMERRFVLEPLAEIAPDLTLPGGQTAVEAARSAAEEDNAEKERVRRIG